MRASQTHLEGESGNPDLEAHEQHSHCLLGGKGAVCSGAHSSGEHHTLSTKNLFFHPGLQPPSTRIFHVVDGLWLTRCNNVASVQDGSTWQRTSLV